MALPLHGVEYGYLARNRTGWVTINFVIVSSIMHRTIKVEISSVSAAATAETQL